MPVQPSLLLDLVGPGFAVVSIVDRQATVPTSPSYRSPTAGPITCCWSCSLDRQATEQPTRTKVTILPLSRSSGDRAVIPTRASDRDFGISHDVSRCLEQSFPHVSRPSAATRISSQPSDGRAVKRSNSHRTVISLHVQRWTSTTSGGLQRGTRVSIVE